jgi:hypothetical protein
MYERILKVVEDLTRDYMSPEALDRLLGRNGDLPRLLTEHLLIQHINDRMTEKDVRSIERCLRNILLPLRPVLNFLRERKRERMQRVFEDIEARIDRSSPPAPPEKPVFFISEDEMDDAVFPEEIEELKLKKARKRARRIKDGENG